MGSETEHNNSLLGVVRPDHDCTIHGHELCQVVNAVGEVIQMFCSECGARWVREEE